MSHFFECGLFVRQICKVGIAEQKERSKGL